MRRIRAMVLILGILFLIVISLHFMQAPINKHQMLKSQITSTPPERRRASKLQINYKLQYSMTKTIDKFVFRYLEHVWDFEFLFRLWRIICLVFDICVLEFPRQIGIYRNSSLQLTCPPPFGGFIRVRYHYSVQQT